MLRKRQTSIAARQSPRRPAKSPNGPGEAACMKYYYKNEDDFEFLIGTEYNMVIDAMSMQYLQGAKIDYQEDITGSQFVIKNPNAQSTCGCGSSFSV